MVKIFTFAYIQILLIATNTINVANGKLVEAYYEAGIEFTRKAEKVLLVNSGEYLKEQ